MISHARLTGGLVRKDAVETVHPLVRIHPVTGEKCLYLNGEFITKIQGLKEPEQRWLLDFLMQHIVSGHDFQARVRWQPKTIVIFDNRSTIRTYFIFRGPPFSSFSLNRALACDPRKLATNQNPFQPLDSAIVDYLDDDYGAKLRHIFRLCALGEKPIPVYDDFE
jgi:sulfonate dioxygenase